MNLMEKSDVHYVLTRNKDGKLGMVSIIIDAKKPIVIGDK